MSETKPTTEFKESDAGDGTSREDHYLHGAKLVLCFSAIMMCMFLVALDQLIVAAVLTTISDHFNAFKKMNWLIAAYLITMGGCAQTWGRISISFGRKWIMVIAICLFELGSLIAAVSQNINTFIVGRVIQGMGGSGIQTLAFVLATEVSTLKVRPYLMGCLSLVFVFSSVAGPIIGGAFGTYASWRWCFWINMCFGGLILPFFIFAYTTKPPVGSFRERVKTVDFPDNLLMIAGIVLLCIAVSFGETDGWSHASTISCFVIGGVVFIVFLVYNFKFSKYPAIPLDLVKAPGIVAAFLTFSFNYTAMLVLMQYLSVYFENVAGHNAFHTGVSLLPVSIPITFGAMSSPILIKKTGHIKIWSVISAILLPIGIGLQSLLPVKENMGYSIGFQIILGVASGIGFQSPIMSSHVVAPKSPGSTILATALLNTGRSVFSALFTLIAGVIYGEKQKIGLRKIAPQMDSQTGLQSISSNLSLLSKLDSHDRLLVRSTILQSFKGVVWLCLACSAVCLISTLLMSNARMPAKATPQETTEST